MRVFVFSVLRMYSNHTSRKCAFCILLLLHVLLVLGEHLCPSVFVDQRQFIREALALMDFLEPVLLHLKGGDTLHRAPACDMAIFVLSEDAIEQTCRAEKADMPAVQRGDRPASCCLLLRKEGGFNLLPGGRANNEVFELIEWQAAIAQRSRARSWNAAGGFLTRQGGKRIRPDCPN